MRIIKPVRNVFGRIVLPGDKSVSHRAVMVGAISNGITEASGVLKCDDCDRTIGAFRAMGITIKLAGRVTVINGRGLEGLKRPRAALDMGESGTTIRLLAGILSGQRFKSTLTCAPSLSKRPMRRITEPLSLMGARISAAPGGTAPLTIEGADLKAVSYKMPVASAQVKSALLFAGLYADGRTRVREPARSRDHTERMLRYFGARVRVKGLEASVAGGFEMEGRKIDVPSDVSSASFFMLAASLLEGSRITIPGVCVNPTRAGVIPVMKRMGVKVKVSNLKKSYEPVADITVSSSRTRGVTISSGEIPAIIDELPVIFVLAALSRGTTVIRGAGELRVKETDRISSMSDNLRAMGARIKAKGCDIIIEGVPRLRPASLKSFGDHRTCMASTVAALASGGECIMDDTRCVNKSFPGFFRALEEAGNYV